MSIYFPPTQNSIQKTLDAQLLSGVTASMTLNNVVGIANKPGVCVVDFVDTNNVETPTKREYIAFTGVSGNTLTGLTRNADGGGSDQDHSVGAIVQFPPDILQQKAIIDTILVQHGDDGVHTDALVTSLKASGAEINTGTEDGKIVTPKAIANSNILVSSDNVALTATATELNNLHSKTLNLGAWTSYTVTPTNLTIGSGTMVGKYIQVGKLVIGKIRIVLAADSSISGTVYLSKPVTSVSTSFPTVEGDCSLLDSGTAEASGRLLSSDTGKFTVQVFTTAGTYLTIAAVNATVPWTWATGDVIDCKFVYEAA